MALQKSDYNVPHEYVNNNFLPYFDPCLLSRLQMKETVLGCDLLYQRMSAVEVIQAWMVLMRHFLRI